MRGDKPYDPKVYGKLKADFLNDVAGISESDYDRQERERKELIEDIRAGRLRHGLHDPAN